jgi:DNA-binding CsgD family transcriptional regulator/PAS domain-containing protein
MTVVHTIGTNNHRLQVLIGDIYDAAVTPQLWPAALDRIASEFGAVGAALQDQNEDGSFAFVVSPGLTTSTRAYAAEWWRHDIRAQRAVERGILAAKGVVTDLDLVTPEEMETHPFYTQFLKPHGLGPSVALAAVPASGVIVGLGVQRATAAAMFNAEEITALKIITAHIEKALRVSIRLESATALQATLGEALARLAAGVILLDRDSKVVYANTAGHAVIGGGLNISNRHLVAHRLEDRAALDAAISACLRADCCESWGNPRPVLVRGQGMPLVLYILPVAPTGTAALASFRPEARVLVLALAQGERAPPDPTVVRDVLGLTPGEARVAAMIGAGKTPRDAAEALGLTEETTRTVLKRVFAKAGVSRQIELAGLIERATLTKV